jgi:hypothetical protein
LSVAALVVAFALGEEAFLERVSFNEAIRLLTDDGCAAPVGAES